MTARSLAVVAAALMVSGCASISVQPEKSVSTKEGPERVYVEPFSTAHGEFNVDRAGPELAEFKTDLRAMMVAGITTDLTKRLLPANSSEGRRNFKPQRAWLIRGEFVRVNQGSRLLRGAIGFGAGATKLETRVQVYDLSQGLTGTPFLTFATTGGSNAEPGVVPSLATDPLSLIIEAAGGAGNVAHGVTEDTKRTAREITAVLSDYMYRHGWIYEDQWVKPKIYDNGDKPSASTF